MIQLIKNKYCIGYYVMYMSFADKFKKDTYIFDLDEDDIEFLNMFYNIEGALLSLIYHKMDYSRSFNLKIKDNIYNEPIKIATYTKLYHHVLAIKRINNKLIIDVCNNS